MPVYGGIRPGDKCLSNNLREGPSIEHKVSIAQSDQKLRKSAQNFSTKAKSLDKLVYISDIRIMAYVIRDIISFIELTRGDSPGCSDPFDEETLMSLPIYGS
jgi:hypothetical protein